MYFVVSITVDAVATSSSSLEKYIQHPTPIVTMIVVISTRNVREKTAYGDWCQRWLQRKYVDEVKDDCR